MNNSANSPSSSPTSVAVHQDPRTGDNDSKLRQDLALDESERCASNPQQGTTSHSPPTEPNHSRDEIPGTRKNPNTARMARKEMRQKRPPRLIDTRPNMKIPATHKDNRKLFVGGLPPDVSSDEFYRYFVRYGGILDSVVMFDKTTQRCRGFGFITFEDPQVTADLLRMGGAAEATTEGKGAQNGYLEMRGKVIEIKRAQPKSASPTPGSSPTSSEKSASGSNHSRRRSESRKTYSPPPPAATEYHDYQPSAMKYQMSYDQQGHMHHPQYHHHHPQHMMNHRTFVPATPIPCYSDTSGANAPPMTPQQAVLDLAHHMLFYSQLLATPSLMSQHHGMVSPMMSPGMMGVQAYSDYFQPFYDENNPETENPAKPTLLKVPEGESFEIGDCKFFRETPMSPELDSGKPSLSPAEEKG